MITSTSLSEAELSAGFHTYSGTGTSNTPTQCYAGAWWNGGLVMLTSNYSSDTRVPYHRYDTKCDFGLMLVSPGTGAVTLERTILSDQGLRGLGLFNVDGRLICIGSVSYTHLDVYKRQCINTIDGALVDCDKDRELKGRLLFLKALAEAGEDSLDQMRSDLERLFRNDRHQIIKPYDPLIKGKPGEADLFGAWEPVSYTHLDVYKRQP